MNLKPLNEIYKKISWIYEMPNIFQNSVISTKRLDLLSEDDKKALIYRVISTLNEYFGQIPDHYYEEKLEINIDYSAKFVKSISNILIVWLNGLCDLSAAQIVNGLLDILNLKTEYQKWPPKSVMEFYAVCKKDRPSCYQEFNGNINNLKQIGANEEIIIEKKGKNAVKHLKNIFNTLGKDYKVHLEKRIKILGGKEKRTQGENILYESANKAIKYF